MTDVEKKDVVELGGLHVVGTERHVSRAHTASRLHLSLSGLLCSGLASVCLVPVPVCWMPWKCNRPVTLAAEEERVFDRSVLAA